METPTCSPSKVYEFDEQLKKGEQIEQLLDMRLEAVFAIEQVDMKLQKLGIDRVFVKRKTGERFSVQYKGDIRASETGRVFIETVSCDVTGVKGWALTSIAQKLIYCVPGAGKAYICEMLAIRRALPNWIAQYPERPTQNNGYRTKGIAVPIGEFILSCGAREIDVSEILAQSVKP